MAVQNITYDDKSYLNQNSDIADVNKCCDSDMNEIKSVVNNNATELTNLQAAVLYNNENNTLLSITLNDSCANYSYIEVFFTDMVRFGYTKVNNPNGNGFGAIVVGVVSGEVQLRCANYTISDDVITNTYQHAITLKSATPEMFTGNIYITKVLGYK